MTIWRTHSSWTSLPCSPNWMRKKWMSVFFFIDVKRKDTKRPAGLSPTDISMDLFRSDCPFPHLSFPLYGTRECVFVLPLVCLLWSFKDVFEGSRYGRSQEPLRSRDSRCVGSGVVDWVLIGWSHFCLQVHDLLAHEGNGGTGFLPLHRLQLQRRRRNRFQVLPHPGRWRVGLSYALPRSLVGRLWLVLHTGSRTRNTGCWKWSKAQSFEPVPT